MLRSVFGDYLNSVKEREFDLPFMTLLPAMGFYDIHFTHGQVEFGKDFIAKRIEDGTELQYSFQLKAGDINQADWRNNTMGQILETILTGLSHPNFNRNLPQQTVLATTGRLIGNAALESQDFNKTIEEKYKARPVIFWEYEQLIDYLETFGLEGVHRVTASGFVSYGNFYLLYGKSLQGNISEREIEQHSRQWLDESLDPNKVLLAAAIEAEVLAKKCVEQGFLYEAVHTHLGAFRVLLYQVHEVTEPTQIRPLQEVYTQARRKLYLSCKLYLSKVQQSWIDVGKDLVKIVNELGGMFTYLVHCARILEIAGYLYFLEEDHLARDEIISFLQDFISHEPGCAHIPSDRYAISLVFPVIALCDSSQLDTVRELLRRAVIWLCDRYQEGFGLANFEATPYTEITTLLGYPFEFIPGRSSSGSFLASVICDLAAFLGDGQFYSDVVNDVKASIIFPQYWQVLDTKGLFQIEGEDVISYPNIEYIDILTKFNEYRFAEHIMHEPRSFRVAQCVGPSGLMALTLLLRDRYFPTLWPSLIQNWEVTH